MSLNFKREIFNLSDNNIRLTNIEDGTLTWENVDIEASFYKGNIDEFAYKDYFLQGNQGQNAAAKNMFVLLQNIYNNLKKIDDGTYPASIDAYINDNDTTCYGTAYVERKATARSTDTSNTIELHGCFTSQCGEGIQGMEYLLRVGRTQEKTGTVKYSLYAYYNIAGPTTLGDSESSNSEMAALTIAVSNKNGDLVTHDGSYDEYEQIYCNGGSDPNSVGTFYSYDLALYEK